MPAFYANNDSYTAYTIPLGFKPRATVEVVLDEDRSADDVMDWLYEHVRARFDVTDGYDFYGRPARLRGKLDIAFEDKQDAMLCKLTWGGK